MFYVWLHVKPYVRHYLLSQFGASVPGFTSLVDLRPDAYLANALREGLERHCERRDRQLERNQGGRRRALVRVLVTHEQFKHYGWALSLTEERRLNQILEARCKSILLSYLSSMYMVCGNLQVCIRKFYEEFGYDDETWPVDSIRKIWLRAVGIPKINIQEQLFEKFSTFFVGLLSENRTTLPLPRFSI